MMQAAVAAAAETAIAAAFVREEHRGSVRGVIQLSRSV